MTLRRLFLSRRGQLALPPPVIVPAKPVADLQYLAEVLACYLSNHVDEGLMEDELMSRLEEHGYRSPPALGAARALREQLPQVIAYADEQLGWLDIE